MFDLLQDQFYWSGMTKDLELHIAKCDKCIQYKSKAERASLENIQATYLLQLVHLDYLTIEMTESGKDAHLSLLIILQGTHKP